MELAPRAEADAGLRCADGLDDGVDDLEAEARSVLDRPAVLVRPVVGYVLLWGVSLSSLLLARRTHQELINQVAIRAVDLDTIEARALDRVLGSSRVPLHVLLDLGDGERARCLVVAGELDRGGSDVVEGGVFRFQLSRNSRASEGPELEVDEGALGVDCVCDLALGECDRLLGCVFTRTSFHLLICSSLQMPGTFV